VRITSDNTSDDTDDVTSGITSGITSDVTWMSYVELGRARGISAASAKRLAIRRHWRRHQGNDGTARVAVPATETSQREARPGDDTGDVTAMSVTDSGALAALADAVSLLREQLTRATARADTERARADQAEARADAERDKAAAVERLLAQTVASHNRIAVEIEALRQADRDRRAAGRVARLRAAWRGE
jgi:hypothetical protein